MPSAEPDISRTFFLTGLLEASKKLTLRVSEIKTVQIHNLGPGCHKIAQELRL
jgi:hypothetical protein